MSQKNRRILSLRKSGNPEDKSSYEISHYGQDKKGFQY